MTFRLVRNLSFASLFTRVRASALGCVLLIPLAAHAGPDTWVGGAGGDNNWSTTTNWSSGVVPSNNDDLVFQDGSFTTSNNNLLTGVNSMTFNGGTVAFTISGNALTLGPGTTTTGTNAASGVSLANNSTTTQTISVDGLTLSGGTTIWQANTAKLDVTSAVNLDGTTLSIVGAKSTEISGVISGQGSGAGSIIVGSASAAGNLILDGDNTYGASSATGGFGTVLMNGTLTVNNSGALGSGGLSIQATGTNTSATLANTTSGVTLMNTVDVESNFTVAPTGTLTLGGAVTLNTGGKMVTITNTSTGAGNSLAIDGIIGETGGSTGLTLTGGGTFVFGAINTYTGGTFISNGTLQLGVDEAVKSGTDLTVNAADGSGAATFDLNGHTQTLGNLNLATPLNQGQSTTVTIGNGGHLILEGNINVGYSSQSQNGVVVIGSNADSGTLQLSNTGTINVVDNLATPNSNNGEGDLEIDAQITAGAINYNGASSTGNGLTSSILYLTNSNTYAGGTNIESGDLLVGVNTGTLTPNSTGTSTALGTGDVINSGTAGASLLGTDSSFTGTALTIQVGHNYTQGGNGTLLLNVTSAGGVAGTNYDTLAVTHSATLGGTLDLNFFNPSLAAPGQHYVVVTAGDPTTDPTAGLTGTFGTVDTNLGPEFKAIMSYTDDSAILTLMFEFSGFSQLTPNQLAVANYIDAHDTTITTGDFANGIVPALNAAGMSGQLQHALDELSPQRLQMLSSVAFNNYTFATQHLDDHLTSVRDGAYGLDTSGFAVTDSTLSPDLSQIKSRLLAWSPAPTPGMLSDASSVLGVVKASDPKGPDKISEARIPDRNWSAFISGNVVLAHVDQTSDVAKSNYTTGGATAGLDYRVTTNLRVGALMDYEHTDADLDNEGSKAHIDTYQPGIYLAYADKYGFYANGLLSYGHNDYSEDRNIIFGGLNRTAHGSPSGDQYGLNVDGGFDLHRDGGWTFGPAVGLTYVHLGIDNFSESGADAASLNINSQSADSLRTRLGVDIRYSDKIASVLLTPHLNISWQHEFMDDSRTLTGQFEQAGLGTFGVQTTGPNRDSALIALGVDAEINSSLTLFLDYLADVGGNDYLGQSAQGGAKLAF